jgi:hypothetical protein
MNALDQAKATVQPDEVVELGVWRAGAVQVIRVRGGQIGINGRFVEPGR